MRVCAITRVGICASAALADNPHTSISAGPAFTIRVLPLIVGGMGFTCTPFWAADARSRSASNVSDHLVCETTPKLTGPETQLGRAAGVSRGRPDWARAAAASLRNCGLGAAGSHVTSP